MIKVFEMFAGYGGASFGLEKAGIQKEIVGFSEINKFAIQCYNKNHINIDSVDRNGNVDGLSVIRNYGDATKINPEELPDFDLLTGGFPCQAFSVAGKRKGFEDMRGTLIYDIIRIADYKKPKYMLLENVKGLINHDDGRTWETIRWALKKIGYDILYKVLNSKDYGIPQNRERIWIVCKYGKWDFMEFQFPGKNKMLNVNSLLEKEVDEKYYLNKKNLEALDHHLKRRDKKIESVLCQKKTYLNCLTTHAPKRALHDSNIIIDNNKYRTLTPKESFRFMGFVDDEINIRDLSDNALYTLAGNGWDINIASLLLKELLKHY